MPMLKAVRGAIGVAENSEAAIHAAGRRLVTELLAVNRLVEKRVVSILFTLTGDLDQGNPATGLRALGFAATPLLCVQEARVAGAAARIVRVLVYARVRRRTALRPVYLEGAESLRPDLQAGTPRGKREGAGA